MMFGRAACRRLYEMPDRKARRDLTQSLYRQACLATLGPKGQLLKLSRFTSREFLMISARACFTLLLFAMSFHPSVASAEYVIEVPVLAATRANNQGAFEIMIMRWDQRPQPDPIELIRYNSRVRLGTGNVESIDLAFAYAVERTAHLRQSGTVSIFGHAYRATNSDGPSAGAVMTVGFIAMLKGDRLLRGIAMTGTLESGGRIGAVGSIPDKMRAAAREGYRTILVPSGQMYGPTWNLNEVALELNLIVKEVESIDQAYELMTGRRI